MIHPHRRFSLMDNTMWKLCTFKLTEDLTWPQGSRRTEVVSTIAPKERKLIAIDADAFWSDDEFKKDQEVVMMVECTLSMDTDARKVCFISSAEFARPFFEGRNVLGAFECMKKMLSLPPVGQITACSHIRHGIHNFMKESYESISSMDLGALKTLFEVVEPNLLPEQRAACKRWFNAPGRNHGREKIEGILSCRPSVPYGVPEITYERIMTVFNNEIQGYEDMKVAIAKSLIDVVQKKGMGLRIFIHGLPGTGKTVWGHTIAKAMSRPCKRVDLGGVTSTLTTIGCESPYENSEPGVFFKFISENGAAVVFICDEWDKMGKQGTNRGKDGEVAESLLKMFDPDRPYLCDAYPDGVPVDLTHAIFVVTANRIDNVPAEVLSRFDLVFRMEPYSENVILKILHSYALKLEKAYNLQPGWIGEDAIREIIRYRKDFGARDAIGHLKMLAAGWTEKLTAQSVRQELLRVVDINDSAVRYHMHEFDYPEIQKKVMLDLFSRRIGTENLSEQEKRALDLRLEYLTKLVPEKNHTFDVERYYQIVNQRLYGMYEAKIQPAAELYAASVSKSRPKPLLFAGPAGVGKSTFAEAIAACSGRKYIRFQMNGVASPEFINGNSKEAVAADAGKPIRRMAAEETTSPLMYFDEIEKADQRCLMAMLDIFDDAGKFYDHFLDCTIDISGALLIASCNDISAINPVLLSRFTVIHVPGYSASEKRIIAKQYLLPTLTEGTNVRISEEVTDEVLRYYECDAGVRSMKHGFQTLIKQCMLEHRHEKGVVEICLQDVKRILGPKPHSFTACAAPGCVNSLAVAGGSHGIVSPIRVTMLHSGTRRVTGLAEESIRDSIAVAETWLEEKFGYRLDAGFHIHFGPAGIKKNGSSAGTAIAMAMLSAATGNDISNVAFTGEFDGIRILPVGGIPLKVQAAKSAGIRTVYLPRANRNDIDVDLFDNIEIVFVDTIDEIVEKLISENNEPNYKPDAQRRIGRETTE